MNPYFDLIDLQLFVYVADRKSLTKGAAAAHISAPAASMRVRKLENDFGTRLLERTRKGVSTTVAGQAFLRHAHLMLEQAVSLNADLRSFAEGTRGHLRIAANTSTMSETLPPVLRRYMKLHPGSGIDLRPRLNREVSRAVSEDAADIGLYGGDFHMEGLQTLRYLEDRFVLITSAEHPLANRESLALAEALEYDVIGLPEYSSAYAFMCLAVDEKRLASKTRIWVDNYDAMFRMIEANVGVGVTTESAARRYGRNEKIGIVPLSDKAAVRHFSVCARNFEALPEIAKHFLDILLEAAPKATEHPASAQ